MTVGTSPAVSAIEGGSHAGKALRLPYGLWFPLLVYALTRAIDAVFIVIAGHRQVAMIGLDPSYLLSFPSPAAPSYGDVATNWDGQWYRLIAQQGYPHHLPLDAHGHVLMNPWASVGRCSG